MSSRSRLLRPSALALAVLALSASLSQAQAVTASAPTPTDVPASEDGRADASRHSVTVTGHRIAWPVLPPQPGTLESVSAALIEESINSATTAGVLQYLPSLHVRERYIGDRNGVLVMRVNSSIASAQTTVYADGLLLSNFLANSFSTAPRWGLVAPEEIERVDVMYGPFSAQDPGNSAGGVVRLVTRMPTRFEAHARLEGFTQRFREYGTDARFGGGHASASLGTAFNGNGPGSLAAWITLDHLDNESQPQTFGNLTAKTGAAAAAGTYTDASGSTVYRDIDTAGKPRIIVSSTGIDHTVQDLAKLKLAWRPHERLQATYTLGLWRNTSDGRVASDLRDASGRTIWNAGSAYASPLKYVRIDGVDYTVSTATPSRSDSEHWMHGLALDATLGGVEWQAVASHYRQKKDLSRTATPTSGYDDGWGTGLGGQRPGGQLTDASGTGWHNLDLRGLWRTAVGGQAHTLAFGLHHDRYRLASVSWGTTAAPIADWLASDSGTLNTNSYGKTQTDAVYLQDEWQIAPTLTLTAGGRQERWRAYDGSNYSAANASPNPKNLVYADRAASHFSPKLQLAWAVQPQWLLRGAYGHAVRYPTVAEMFQTFNGANGIRTNDPNLRPEQVDSLELMAQHRWDNASLRASWFHEHKRDALISQTDVTVTPNISSIQNLDRVRTQGLEIAGQASHWLVHGLDLQGSLTYTHSRITRNSRNPGLEGTAQPRIPDWRATLLAAWHATDRLTTTLAWRFSGRQHNALFNTATGQYNDVNPNVYGAVSHYSVLDAKLHYRVDSRWSVSLGVNNLGNFRYYVNPNPYPQRTWFAGVKFDR